PPTAGKRIAEGQLINKDDVLAQLDPAAFVANREKAEASKKVVMAEKEAAELAVRQAELDVRRLTELRRQQDASSLPLASQIELEKAVAALDTARAHARADDRKLEAADKDISALNQQISLYTLTAPCAGRLGRLQIVLGQTVPAGTVIADVVDVE